MECGAQWFSALLQGLFKADCMSEEYSRKLPMSRHGKSTSSAKVTPPKTKLRNIFDVDGLLSTEKQEAIKTSMTLPALPSLDDRNPLRDWFELAGCKGQTALFFRHSCSKRCASHPAGCVRVKSVRECKAVCADCPVLEHCRIWALAMPLQCGVAGGMTESERDRFRITVLGVTSE